MRISILVFSIALAGCADAKGGWPSLARRPIEGSASGKIVAVQTVATVQPAVPAAIADLPARLATLDRDLSDIAARLEAQRTAAAQAFAAARGAKADSDAAAAAQLETSRLERIGNQISDLRSRLDAIAGTLAAAAAGGTDTAALLKATGALIVRSDALARQAEAAAPH